MPPALCLAGRHPLSSPVDIARVAHQLGALRTSPGSHPSDGQLSPPPLSDDELEGAQRLRPDPDSPTSKLLEAAARRSLAAASHQSKPDRKFSFLKDIARNPELAKAARAEAAGQAPGASTGGGGAKLDRQATIAEQIDRDASQESRINLEMAAVMLARLQSAKQTSERLLGVLQARGRLRDAGDGKCVGDVYSQEWACVVACAAAETAFARAMASIGQISLVGDCDGATLRPVMEEISGMPVLLGLSHSSVCEKLQAVVKQLQNIANELRVACDEVEHGTARAKRSVEASRAALKAALRGHQDAACALAAVLAERARHGGRWRGVEVDPWLAEGRLVEAQAALVTAQQQERAYLRKAYERVGVLELRRVAVVCEALSRFLAAYSRELVAVQAEAGRLQVLLDEVDAEGDLVAFNQMAASSVRDGEALSQRQAEMLASVSGELLGSPEITRQGPIERWDSGPGKWAPSYLVLTRAGFLHAFSGAPADGGPPPNGRMPVAWWQGAAVGPVESLNLARCSFEQGEAPVFRLIEQSTGGLTSFGLFAGRAKAVTLKGGSIDNALEWALSIRDQMNAVSGR
eukprot:scaffold2.g7200.t1